jgi:hypothetical protein
MNRIKVSDIILTSHLQNSIPRKEKLDKILRYYIQHKEFDVPVILEGNILVDGYARYYAARECGIEEVPCINLLEIEYITAKFSHGNKRYIWKNIHNIPIKVGDTVLVQCNKEVKAVKVLTIFQNNDYRLLKHKNILKNYSNSTKDGD